MNTLYSKFQHLEANFVMSCSQNALKSLEKKEVILSWKSLEIHNRISVRTLQYTRWFTYSRSSSYVRGSFNLSFKHLVVVCIVVVKCEESPCICPRRRWHHRVDWGERSTVVVGRLRPWSGHSPGTDCQTRRIRGKHICLDWLQSFNQSFNLYTAP